MKQISQLRIYKNISATTKKDLRLSSIRVIGLVLGFGLQVFFTKVVGLKEYGLYVLFTSWTTFLSLLLILGYDKFILKQLSYYFIQKQDAKFKSTLHKLLIYVSINSIIFLVISFFLPHDFLTDTLFPKELLRSSWLIIAVGTVIATIFNLLGKVLSAVQRVELNYFRSEILQKCLWFVIVLAILFFFREAIGINIIILGVILAQIFTLLLLFFYVDRDTARRYRAIEKEKVALGRENYVFFFTSLNYYIIAFADKLVLGMYEPLETLGIYGLVVTLISIASFSAIVYQRFLPKISNYILTGNIAGLESDFKTVSRNSLMIALPFIMFLLVFTHDILLFFGEHFTSGTPILRILIWGQLINFLTGPNGNILLNGYHSKTDFINSIVIVILTLAFLFLGYRYYGVLGVAAATSVGVLLINLVKVIEVKLFYNIFPYELHNVYLIVLTFLSFYSVSLLNIGFDSLLLRLATNFVLSLLVTSIPLLFFYYHRTGSKLRLKSEGLLK